MSPTFQEFILWFPAVVVALTVHEFAHAYVADRLGDPTARALGRVTLNPLSHLDMMGTILLVIMHFGWGRPVPVDTRYLANPKRDMLVIAAAGPAINVVTALVVGLGLRLFGPLLLTSETGVLFYLGLRALVLLSLLLAFFNLLPVPPLDGSKVLVGVLPIPLANSYARHSSLLSWGLMGLIVVGAMTGWHPLSKLIYPPARGLYVLLTGTDMP
jgi:Zn-dependent protease|tara:strand:+ start:1371 stop:2012 length:642 start_codon:yes stop_codon:yes gene_type:complete